MSWMSQLYKTYENNAGKVTEDENEPVLMPLAHMQQTVQVEITLSADGEFRGARQINKDDRKESKIVIPVTEKSASRSSGTAPHALCDNLTYLAADFTDYMETNTEKAKKDKATYQERHKDYLNQLKDWTESEYTHPKVESVYQYVLKGKIIGDLVQSGLIKLTDEGHFLNQKINGQSYDKVMVCFRVFSLDKNIPEESWKDSSLQENYIKYYISGKNEKKDICYITGKWSEISENHPKGIIAAQHNAKLISANDNKGFSYRGRFMSSEEAYSLSYEASQKIHSALSWLVEKQGIRIGTKDIKTIVCWNPVGKKVLENIMDVPWGEEENEDRTESGYRKKLWKTIQGKCDQFGPDDDVVIMALDAATTGRLSITYYTELKASDFFDRVRKWWGSCCWYFYTKSGLSVKAPGFEMIVNCAYGTEQEKGIKTNDKVKKEQVQRLLHCMLDNCPIPYDIVHLLTEKASRPEAYSEWINREKVLSVACACIAKYHIDKKNENMEGRSIMTLDLQNHNRSYLFGRLLAVLEKAESCTYSKGENRETNAIRLQSAFVNHPMQVWKILEEAVRPYFQKMDPMRRAYYKNKIGEIVAGFEESRPEYLNKALESDYLLGYYLQRADLNTKKEDKQEEKER